MTQRKIPLSSPICCGSESEFLLECVQSGFLGSAGRFLDDLKIRIGDYLETEHVVLCGSGTSAIHLALLANNIPKNSEVLCPSSSFIATVNPILYHGCVPIFVGLDPFFNMDLSAVLEFLNKRTFMQGSVCVNAETGRQISAVIPVHMWGNPVEICDIKQICDEKNIAIIEDAAEALGSSYANRCKVGSAGSCGCISFNSNKIITGGGGGALVTNSSEIADRASYLAAQAKCSDFHYQHGEVGYNYRMSNLTAAVVLAQMESLDDRVTDKIRVSTIYRNRLADCGHHLRILDQPHGGLSNSWLPVLVLEKTVSAHRDGLVEYLAKLNVEARPVWPKLSDNLYLSGYQSIETPGTDDLLMGGLCLPSSYKISEVDIAFVCEAIEQWLEGILCTV